jgi:hypothetical protein
MELNSRLSDKLIGDAVSNQMHLVPLAGKMARKHEVGNIHATGAYEIPRNDKPGLLYDGTLPRRPKCSACPSRMPAPFFFVAYWKCRTRGDVHSLEKKGLR